MATSPPAAEVIPAPTDFRGVTRQLGPGMILSAIIVGAGELIVTPKLGAQEGFKLLWFIVLGCLLKVFVQIELGRYTILNGRATLHALNSLPGPRAVVSWVVWLWLAMYVALVFQVAGIVGGVATIFSLGGVTLSLGSIAIAVSASCVVLLVVGRYRLIEGLSMALVGVFIAATAVAVAALQGTQYAVTGAQIASGFSFHLPEKIVTAFGAFGLIGVGASELTYYPYWCLEKGYAKFTGPNDGSAEWKERARGWLRIMRIDAWSCFAMYTTTTLAFYLLGAAILHARGMEVEDKRMIETLSFMYRDVFGEWSFYLFLVGAFAVLYSTIFGATASNARLLADALTVFKLKTYRDAAHHTHWVKISVVILAIAFTSVYIAFGAPVSLVFIGAVSQGLMLPFLAGAAVYFHRKNRETTLRAGPISMICLWIAALLMTALGAYQVWSQLAKWL